MSNGDVVSLDAAVREVRRAIGVSAVDYIRLFGLARAGQIPCTLTTTGGYMISRRDIPMIAETVKNLKGI
jgi:hypothetical protein